MALPGTLAKLAFAVGPADKLQFLWLLIQKKQVETKIRAKFLKSSQDITSALLAPTMHRICAMYDPK